MTAIVNPDGMDDAQVRKVLKDVYNVEVQGGQGALKGKIFRIGHMGIASWSDLLVCFAGLERILDHAHRLPRSGAALAALSERMPPAE